VVSERGMTSWVLLRGLTREARHWGRFPGVLAAACPGADILTPDLPGAGRRHGEISPVSVAGLLAGVRDSLRAAGPAPPYRLLGLSLGGMVALEWAARHPEEVAGCVLINTSLRPLSPFFQRLAPRHYPALLRAAFGPAGPEAREALILGLTSRLALDRPALLRAWSAWRRECPVSAGNALRQLAAAARYRLPPGLPPLPILVLAAARDALVAPACSARLAESWGLPLALHPEAGHDLPLDDPEWVAERTRVWLAQSIEPGNGGCAASATAVPHPLGRGTPA
jgi:pimeloyl-ACP methyl ester carboxylesterase